jgi:hypothetical protein
VATNTLRLRWLQLTTARSRPIFPRHDRFAWDFATTTRLSSFMLLRRRCRVPILPGFS